MSLASLPLLGGERTVFFTPNPGPVFCINCFDVLFFLLFVIDTHKAAPPLSPVPTILHAISNGGIKL